jgi:hypothetical protein
MHISLYDGKNRREFAMALTNNLKLAVLIDADNA